MTDIQPFGTSNDAKSLDGTNDYGLKTIKAFGCTVVSFDISADWASQAGSLSMTLIEDEADGDRLSIPVIGSPYIFELQRDDTDEVIFEHVGIVDSFSRSSSSSTKTYSVSIASPLKILDATQVIINGFTGLGAAMEGKKDFSGFGAQLFGSNNRSVKIDNNTGSYHWFNVSNLINVFGILENEDKNFRVPRDIGGTTFGDFGFSAISDEGIPLTNLLWALHVGINHLPKITPMGAQKTHGGNLLYGRHNYNLDKTFEGIPYFYDFDALGFFNQVINYLGPQYRFPGDSSSLNEIIQTICNDANLEYYIYIDINKNEGFGEPTLREFDPNWSQPSNCSWDNLNESNFTEGGRYGGTIRVGVVDKNAFFNPDRPFSEISYNLLGLEVPDLQQTKFTNTDGVSPGKRPGQPEYGLSNNDNVYSDPLDSKGLDSDSDGFTEVGTKSVADGGNLTSTGFFDSNQMANVKVIDSNLSLQAADAVTMKVVVGGYQSRLVHVPRTLIKQYWGDIVLMGAGSNLRDEDDAYSTFYDTPTDNLGVNKFATRKIPVVTQLLDPSDTDDFVFIDMQSIFGNLTIPFTIHRGIYVASIFEIRLAMNGFDNWVNWWNAMKAGKRHAMINFFYPDCYETTTGVIPTEGDRKEAQDIFNNRSGLGYGGASVLLNCTNPFTMSDTNMDNMTYGFDCSGNPKGEDIPPPSGGCTIGSELECFPTGLFQARIHCDAAKKMLQNLLLPEIHEKIKQIGDTHYGKSWYVPLPYVKTKSDLDSKNLVGNYKRSWECADSAYVEPIDYYPRQIPQTSQFVQDGKVSAFCNYKNDFFFPATNTNPLEDIGRESYPFDDSYLKKLESPFGRQERKTFNFSEYGFDELAQTIYSYNVRDINSDAAFSSTIETNTIIHAKPENVNCSPSYLPYCYQYAYNRFLMPFSNTEDASAKMYADETLLKNSGIVSDAIKTAVSTVTTWITSQAGPKEKERDIYWDNPLRGVE